MGMSYELGGLGLNQMQTCVHISSPLPFFYIPAPQTHAVLVMDPIMQVISMMSVTVRMNRNTLRGDRKTSEVVHGLNM